VVLAELVVNAVDTVITAQQTVMEVVGRIAAP